MDKRKTIFTVLMTGALAVVAAFGAITYRTAYAQSPTPTVVAPSGQTTQPGQTQPAAPQGPGGRGMRGGG